MDQQCIWCRKKPPFATFNKVAHTFPRALGGRSTCPNVCDECNRYFGSPTKDSPAVEVVLKEMLNISKYILLNQTKSPPKERFKSEYFNYNPKVQTIKTKTRYNLRRGFQEKLGRLFCRGLYKVFLEERENQRHDALDERFDFVREFSRYNLNEEKVYIFKPKFGVVYLSTEDTLHPLLRFTDVSDELDLDFRAFEYHIMGHYFCIPTSRLFENTCLSLYKKRLKDIDHPFGLEILPIRYATDIDITFSHLDTKSPNNNK